MRAASSDKRSKLDLNEPEPVEDGEEETPVEEEVETVQEEEPAPIEEPFEEVKTRKRKPRKD